MNNDVIKFIKRNNMDLKKLLKSPASRIDSTKDVNTIINNYGVFNGEEDSHVSVADVVGYDYGHNMSNNLLLNLANFFDSKGNGYHSRSIGMLNYSSDEIIEKLGASFKKEPIVIKQLTGNNYLVDSNGLHRYAVLRAHFINESYGLDVNSEKYWELKEKYKIPVKLKKVDLIKTYSNFLLSINPDFDYHLELEINKNYEYTGNVILSSSNNKRLILDNNTLIDFLEQVLANTQNRDYFDRISRYVKKYISFDFFININFPNISSQIKGGKVK